MSSISDANEVDLDNAYLWQGKLNSQFIGTASMVSQRFSYCNAVDIQCPPSHNLISSTLFGGCGLHNCELRHRHLAHSTNRLSNNRPSACKIENFVTINCELIFGNILLKALCHTIRVDFLQSGQTHLR